MVKYISWRVLLMIPTLFAISIVAFIIIQLPPGDFLTTMVAGLEAQGDSVSEGQILALQARYGLDQPIYLQYLTWVSGIVTRGDFGLSFEWNENVATLLGDRLPYTILLSLTTLIFTWIVAFPIGLFSAVRQYSIGDYLATVFGFLGLATPNFLLALVLMWLAFDFLGVSVGGLFSPAFQDATWNLGKIIDLLSHLWIPIIVLGTAGTAGLIRILRANLLDELRKPYVVAARARGVPKGRLIRKYPLRTALNPFVSTVGWVLPGLVSGEVIVSRVLNLPTTGQLLIRSLQSQDMYLAGSIIMIVSALTVVGTLLSDILLAWLDPRVRYRYG